MPVAVPTTGPRPRPSMPELSARADLVKRRRREIKARIATGRKARSRRELAAVIRSECLWARARPGTRPLGQHAAQKRRSR
jgi:hypothetical protein